MAGCGAPRRAVGMPDWWRYERTIGHTPELLRLTRRMHNQQALPFPLMSDWRTDVNLKSTPKSTRQCFLTLDQRSLACMLSFVSVRHTVRPSTRCDIRRMSLHHATMSTGRRLEFVDIGVNLGDGMYHGKYHGKKAHPREHRCGQLDEIEPLICVL